MLNWLARTFPTLARLDAPKWVFGILMLGLLFSIGAGVGSGIKQRKCIEGPAMPSWCPLTQQEPIEMPDGTSAL